MKTVSLDGLRANLTTRYKMLKLDRGERRMARVQERQADLSQFSALFEDFVEVICQSAQLGCSEKREAIYETLRGRLIDLYPSLRPFLGAYLESEDDLDQSGTGIRMDCLELLLAPPDLAEFLATDDGSVIERIGRTRESLMLYAEHLSHLAKRIG
ncbi:MAG TPA: hypothetical protein VG944_19645 [Fimbriimonas sp.]|nr:hypothetical protein [Fimbriimonas sp.]